MPDGVPCRFEGVVEDLGIAVDWDLKGEGIRGAGEVNQWRRRWAPHNCEGGRP